MGRARATAIASLAIAVVAAASAGGARLSRDPVGSPGVRLISIAAAAQAAESPAGAAACSGCHPASASTPSPVPRLVGLDAAAIVRAMQDFRAGTRPGTVMDRIAKGFTDEEVRAIAAWYAGQR
jgi:cytochrome c553